MCPGFPRLGVLRRLRPVPDRSADGGPSPTTAPDARRAGQDRDGSRVHCCSLDEGGARLCPCGIATATPQHFTVASRRASKTAQEFPDPTSSEWVRTAPGPYPPDSSRRRIKGRKRRFLAYSSPSRSPDPHHLAVLARPGFVRAAPTLPGTSRIRLPSAPPPCCDRASGEGLSPPLEQQRLTAHRGSAPYPGPRSGGALRVGGSTVARSPSRDATPVVEPQTKRRVCSSTPGAALLRTPDRRWSRRPLPRRSCRSLQLGKPVRWDEPRYPGGHVDPPLGVVDLIMMSTAQHDQVVDVGGAAVLPLDHVVHLAPARWSITPGVGAAAVAGGDRSA